MTDKSVEFLPNPEVVAQPTGDERVLVHLGTNQIYSLNSTAVRLWELIEQGVEESRLADELAREFDVERAPLAAEIRGLIEALVESGLLLRSAP